MPEEFTPEEQQILQNAPADSPALLDEPLDDAAAGDGEDEPRS